MNPPKILIVAAESSSALYATRLLEFWKNNGIEVEAFGIGNSDMERLGFHCIGYSEDMAVVGLQEVLAHWDHIKKVFYSLVDAAEKKSPQFCLLLDYPDFNLRLAKKLKSKNQKVIYYISPQLWAWRKGRIKTIRRFVDLMLVLFPFESDFYKNSGVPVKFVGHPLLDEMDFERQGVEPNSVVTTVGLMPGSRKSELKHCLQVQLNTARALLAKYPHLKVRLLVAPGASKSWIQEQVTAFGVAVECVQDTPIKMIGDVDIVLCASGTATVLVGLMAKPMVIMYKMNALTAFFAKRLVRGIKYFGMVNLIFGKKAVPEYFQDQANEKKLVEELSRYIDDQQYYLQTIATLRQLPQKLGDKGATKRVAQELERFF